MSKLFDKTGREVVVGDVLKVFHFTEARRKRHYMFKQVMGTASLGANHAEYLRISHLDLSADSYVERLDGRVMADWEIVQSIDAMFDRRPRAVRNATLQQQEPDRG